MRRMILLGDRSGSGSRPARRRRFARASGAGFRAATGHRSTDEQAGERAVERRCHARIAVRDGVADAAPDASHAVRGGAPPATGSGWSIPPGSWNRLALWQVDGSSIGGILLTHFHSDHIGDLGRIQPADLGGGAAGPLPVYGGPGVDRVVNGFSEAYALDRGYRIAHHGAAVMVPAVGEMEARMIAGPAEGAGPTVVLKDDDLTITAFAVDHAPMQPAYGYRFDYRGRSVVVSGDTVKSDAGLIAAAKGADVLVHEAQANHLSPFCKPTRRRNRPRVAKILHDIPSYHTTPVEAAEAANEAGVRLLVMYHLTPPPPAAVVEQRFRPWRQRRPSRRLDAGRRDGLLITPPVGSDAVDVGRID